MDSFEGNDFRYECMAWGMEGPVRWGVEGGGGRGVTCDHVCALTEVEGFFLLEYTHLKLTSVQYLFSMYKSMRVIGRPQGFI